MGACWNMQKMTLALSLCVHAMGAFGADVDRITLKTNRSTVVFDRARNGAVVSLVDNATGTEFVNGSAAQDLFAIAWTRPGDTSGKLQWLAGHDAEQVAWDKSDGNLRAVFKQLGGQDMTVTCMASTAAGRDDVRWRLRVTGAAPIVLEKINFPFFDLRVPLLNDGQSDAVVVGLTKGGVFHEPAKWALGRGVSFSQPGPLAAQFGCYYSPRAGLLSHTRDARGFPKVLECLRTKDELKWAWQRRCYHSMDEPFELGYEVSTTTFTAQAPGASADWRDAADIYKQWALEQPWCAAPYAKRTDVPDWMKAGPSMIRFHRDWLGKPERVEGWQGTDYLGRSFRDDTVKVRGAASMRLENRLESDIVQVSQNISVGSGHLQTGHTYRLRARVKVEQLDKSNAINAAALTPQLGSKGSWRIPMPAPGDWAEGGVEFIMPPEATFLRIMLHVDGPCRLWVDDLALEEQIDGQWQPFMQPGLPPEHEFVKQWIEIFHGEGRPYLMLGKMTRPPKLIDPAPVTEQRPQFTPIMLNAYRALDGSEAAIIANATGEKQNVRFQWRQKIRTLQMAPWTMRLVK